MSNTTETKTVDIDKIHIVADHNPRKHFDPDAQEDLTSSIKEHGILQPLLLEPAEKPGEFNLVAGERRLTSAKAAGLAQVPALVATNGHHAGTLATVENLVRTDLNPVEEAQAFSKIIKETGCKRSELAARVSVSPSVVTERLRLLELPVEAQKFFATGELPAATAKFIEKIGKVSQPAAAHVADILASEQYRERAHEPERIAWNIVSELSERVRSEEHADLPTLEAFALIEHNCLPTNVSVEWGEDDAEVVDAWHDIADTDPYFLTFSDADVDTMNSLGVLLEISSGNETWSNSYLLCFDPEVLRDRVRDSVKRAQKEIKEAEASRIEAEDRVSNGQANTSASVSPGEGSDSEGSAEPVMTKYERDMAEREAAHAFNIELGRNILGAQNKNMFKATTARAKWIAQAILYHESELPGAGIALTDERLIAVESKELKNGKTKTKITFLTPGEARDVARDRIEKAKNIDEVFNVLIGTILSGALARPESTLVSDRRRWSSPAHRGLATSRYVTSYDDTTPLDADALKVLPSEQKKELQERIAELKKGEEK